MGADAQVALELTRPMLVHGAGSKRDRRLFGESGHLDVAVPLVRDLLAQYADDRVEILSERNLHSYFGDLLAIDDRRVANGIRGQSLVRDDEARVVLCAN